MEEDGRAGAIHWLIFVMNAFAKASVLNMILNYYY